MLKKERRMVIMTISYVSVYLTCSLTSSIFSVLYSYIKNRLIVLITDCLLFSFNAYGLFILFLTNPLFWLEFKSEIFKIFVKSEKVYL
jgi:hypothetical protein